MKEDFPQCYEKTVQMMGKLQENLPRSMAGFGQLHKAATADGALSHKVKELIALAIGITVRCDGCIAFHVHDALESGASRDEILETIGIAVLMGGGPSVVYGAEAMEAMEQLEATGSVA
jgi:AhpD family alkylhydroperoxidase